MPGGGAADVAADVLELVGGKGGGLPWRSKMPLM